MPDNVKPDIEFQPKTKEFSYSAKNNTSKNNGVYLFAGVILLIIIIFGAFFYLNNSGNIKTTPNLQKKTDKIAVQKNVISTPAPTSSPVEDKVSAISDLPSYTLAIIDKNALTTYLNNFNIWGRTYNEKANQTTPKKIVFHLSNVEGRINQLIKEPDGTPMFSSEYFSTQDTIDINIYINPKELASANSSDVFDKAFIANIYHLGLLKPIPQDVETKNIMDLYERKEKINSHFFTILKK